MVDFKDFDIVNYLEEQGIDYKNSGKNVGRDCVGVCCTEHDDSSYHLNVHLDKKIFHCWSCGKSGNLVKFVALMESISFAQAFFRIKSKVGFIDYEEDKGLLEVIVGILDKDNEVKGIDRVNLDLKEIRLPHYIEMFEWGKPYKLYYQYLTRYRLFDPEDFMKWDCYYCGKGEYENRLIFPIRMNQRLVTFATRALSDGASLKHRSQPKEQAIISIKDCLYLYDEYEEGDEVVLCEGVFDALRLKSFGYKALAIFSNQLSDAQILLLLNKLPGKVKVLLDRGEYFNTIKAWHQVMEFIPASEPKMIQRYKDVGECTDENYIKKLLEMEMGVTPD